MTNPTFTVDEFAFVSDDGTESGATVGTINANLQQQAGTANRHRVRLQLHNDNNKAGISSFTWQYSRNSGAWNTIDATTSSYVRAIASGFGTPPADGDDCSNRLTSRGGSYDATNTGWTNDGNAGNSNIDANAYFELELCYYLIDEVDSSGGDTLEFRVIEDGGATITAPANWPLATLVASAGDNQPAYVRGASTASDNQLAYMEGALGASDSKSAYMNAIGVDSDNKSAFVEGYAVNTVDIQNNQGRMQLVKTAGSAAYSILNAEDTTDVETTLKFQFSTVVPTNFAFKVFIRASRDWASLATPTSGYEVSFEADGSYDINRISSGSRNSLGSGTWAGDTNAYQIRFQAIAGNVKFRIWQDGFGEPGTWDDEFATTSEAAGTLQLALVYVATDDSTVHTVYLDDLSYHAASAGTPASDNSPAYIRGQDTASDSQPAYARGSLTASDSQPAYIEGLAGASDNKSAYIRGTDTASDSKSAYLEGDISASDNQPAYVRGTDTASSSLSASIIGGAKTETFTENFANDSMDTAKWDLGWLEGANGPAVTIAEQNSRLELTPGTSSTDYAGWISDDQFSLIDSYVFIRLERDAASEPNTQNDMFVLVGENQGDDKLLIIESQLDPSTINFSYDNGGGRTGATPSWDNTWIWWRIHHDASTDTVYWSTSPNGVDWTTRYSTARSNITWDIGAVRISVSTGTWNSEASPNIWYVHNVNLVEETDSKAAFVEGIDGSTDNKSAYIAGTDTATDNKAAYIKGSIPVDHLWDNFNDNSRDTAKWDLGSSSTSFDNASVTTSEQNNRLEIQPLDSTAGNNYYGYKSVKLYDLYDSAMFVEVPQCDTQGSSNTGFLLQYGSTNHDDVIAIEQDSGDIYFKYDLTGSAANSTSIAYNATNHRWWRIRYDYDADNIEWETSPDGLTWTTQRTVAASTFSSIDLTQMRVHMYAGTYGSVSTPSATYFDNFNRHNLIPRFDEFSAPINVLEHGATEGVDWDAILWGASAPADIIFFKGQFYLYYVGSISYDDVGETVEDRALGVATSNDGVNFTKYGSNPIITYTTGGSTEEGVGGSVAVVVSGTIHLYYAAIRDTGGGAVDLDIRYRSSTDGVTFTNDTLIYSVAGEEHMPVAVIYDGTNYHLYTKGDMAGGKGPVRRHTGTSPTSLADQGQILPDQIGNVGGGQETYITSDDVFFVFDERRTTGEDRFFVRTVDQTAPNTISEWLYKHTYGEYRDNTNAAIYHDQTYDIAYLYTLAIGVGPGTGGAANDGDIILRYYNALIANDSKFAYVRGQDSASDNQPAYLRGSLIETDNKSAFIEGAGTAVSDNKSAYIAGTATTSDSQPAYLRGSLSDTDNKSAYIDGIASTTDNKSAYLRGQDTATANQPAYLRGQDTATANQPAYQRGSLTDTDSQPAYIAGAATATDNQQAYLRGQLSDTDNKQAYIAGSQAASDSQPAYIAGTATASDSKQAYILGSASATDNKAAYMEGIATANDSKSAFIEGLTYMPFTEDWTGVDEDPWRLSHWVTDSG